MAGCLGFVFGHTFGEPQVRKAIAYEDSRHAAEGAAPEPELVSREVQSTAGLGLGMLVYGAAFGGLFSLGFAFVNGRLGRLGVRAMSAVLALCGFVAMYLVPFLKYPANPPAIGDPATIGRRSVLYFTMIGVSLVAAVAAALVGRGARARLGGWDAAIVGVGTYVGIVLLCGLVLPAVDEVPTSFPASTLWWFRVSAVGAQVVLWSAIGLIFGALSERALLRQGAPDPDLAPAYSS